MRSENDIDGIVFDEDGVRDFFYPMAYKAKRDFGMNYIKALKQLFSEIEKTNKKDAEAFLTMQPALFIMACSMAQESLLHHRGFNEELEEPENMAHSRLKIFLDGINEPKIKTWGRYIKRLFNDNNLYSLPIGLSNALNIPISTSFNPLMLKRPEKIISYQSYAVWFYTPTEQEVSEFEPISLDIIDQYFERMPLIDGVPLHDSYLAFLRNYIEVTTKYINIYLKRLEGRQNTLPKKLWVGSCGFILNSVLALAVRRAGGHVVGFDHGQGCNIWSSGLTAFAETQVVDEFVTFGSAAAEAIIGNRKEQGLVDHPVAITYSTGQGKKINLLHEQAYANDDKSGDVKTVMFVQTLFMGKQVGLDTPMPDVVALDWQVRLLRAFFELGYEIILKPHPESKIQIPQDILDQYNVTIMNENFEEVCHKADLIFYDYALTTTFHTGMLSDKSVVYFHFSDAEYPESLRAHLNNRIEIVPGWYDEENRAQIDWDKLPDAIERAKQKTDKTICKLVLPDFMSA